MANISQPSNRHLFQQRHYEALADWWHDQRVDCPPYPASAAIQWDVLLSRFAYWLTTDNPRFSPTKFMDRAVNGKIIAHKHPRGA